MGKAAWMVRIYRVGGRIHLFVLMSLGCWFKVQRCVGHDLLHPQGLTRNYGWIEPINENSGARCSFFEPTVMLRKMCQTNDTQGVIMTKTTTTSQKSRPGMQKGEALPGITRLFDV